MKSQYVRELAEGTRVDSQFFLASKEMRSSRNGEAYLALELADRSGRIPALRFRPDPFESAVPSGTVVSIGGTVTRFRGTKRISVDRIAPVSEYDPADLIESSRRDRDEVVSEFKQVAATVRDQDLRRVLKTVFGAKEFFARFVVCPGARTHHHAYLGGLLDHTVTVATLCGSLADRYEQVDRDLLVAAALLHDVGKVDELHFDTAVDYTDAGRLLGHVVLSERRVREAVLRLRPRVADSLMDRLSHAILAHHGELEWGSPRRPSTVEALLLHHADNLDARTDGFLALTGSPSLVEERWTDASNLFRRPLYAPAAPEEGRRVPDPEEAHYLIGA